ncbi:MAG TPA: Calx-beta domain-containing protein [Pyrinomonadaceae bacterium]
MRQNLKLTSDSLHPTAAHLWRGCVLLSFLLCVSATAAAQTTANIELLSANSTSGHAGNESSSAPQASADGRFVLFQSAASDLVANDTNGATSDIFVRDVQQHTTALVSVNAVATASGNGASSEASITPDGRFVVFTSDASDLVVGDTNGRSDVFVRDLVARTTTLVSVNAAGTGSGDGRSSRGHVTPDGRYVAFTSGAGDLVAGDTNQFEDAFRRDLSAGTTVLVSINTAGTNGGNFTASATALTPDGRYVLFVSEASDLTANDTNGMVKDIFRRDLQTNVTALASVNSAGTGSGNNFASDPSMSDDGQVVVFSSSATDFVPGGAGSTTPSVYAHDFAAGTTTLLSSTSNGTAMALPQISGDGRFVFYVGRNGFTDPQGSHDAVFRRDRLTGDLLQLPYLPVAGGACDDRGFVRCVSAIDTLTTSRDGRYVAYAQIERGGTSNFFLTPGIVIRDMVGGGAESMFDSFGVPALGNVIAGGKITFSSAVSYSALDVNAFRDVYLLSPPAQTRLAFSTSTYSSFESPGFGFLRVRRTGYLIDSTSTVKYITSDGTATAGSDYVAQSGTLTFAPGETSKNISIQLIDDKVVEPDETVQLTLSDPTGDSTLGSRSSATLNIRNDELYSLQLSATSYSASEAEGGISFTVTLLGNPVATTVSIDYATSDGTASERSDYIIQSGTLTFAPGETSRTVRIPVVDDNLVEGDETFNLSLSNPQPSGAGFGNPISAQLKIVDDDTTPPTTNPIDGAQFFVRQHYLDFLNREPDPPGFQFWVGEIESCGADPQCREVKRVNVSAAFFLSIEFQRTGYLAYLANQAAFGPTADGSPAPVRYGQFMHDVQRLQQNLVFGRSDFDAQLEANKQGYFAGVVARPEFGAAFATTLTPEQFVDALFANAGITPTTSERNAAVNEFGSAANTVNQPARARALRRVAENSSFAQAEFNRAFVTMEYFGYLRRDPDAGGFGFWLGKLNDFNGDFVRAEMVKAFISSDEYRQRFGQ